MRAWLGAWLAAAALAAASVPARAASWPEDGWPARTTLHFRFLHPDPGLDPAYTREVERVHRALWNELGGFSVWMKTRRVDFYLYRDRDSYAAGSFKPPAWSQGVAIPPSSRSTPRFATFVGVPTQTVAHELSHLFFGAYWAEVGRRAPRWLDEGVASVIGGDEAVRRRRGFDAPVRVSSPRPLREFVTVEPGADTPQAQVGPWYRQAESLALFLMRGPKPFRFAALCRALRDGEDAERALLRTYSYRSLEALESAWLAWMRPPAKAAPSGPARPASARPAGPREKTPAEDAPRRGDHADPDADEVPLQGDGGRVPLLR